MQNYLLLSFDKLFYYFYYVHSSGVRCCSDIRYVVARCQVQKLLVLLLNRNKNHMGIISWIILGGLAGWIGSMIMGTDASQGVFLNIVIGIIGAMIGGLVFSFFGAAGVTGFNFYSFGVAIIGSIIAIWAVQMLRGAN